MTTWTNSTLRKRLGEAGFLETNIVSTDATQVDFAGTVWERNGFLVRLYEHRDNIHAPFVREYPNGVFDLDPNLLGVRNINTQGNG